MGYSFLTCGDRRLQMQDGDIVLLTSGLVAVGDAMSHELPQEVKELFSWLHSPESNLGPGCIDLRLDHYITKPDTVDALLKVVEAITSRIREFGTIVPHEFINSMVSHATFEFGDQKVDRLLAIFEKFSTLISENQRVAE